MQKAASVSCLHRWRVSSLVRHRVGMLNKGRSLVDRHALKKGVGWLENTQQGKLCSFTNANPSTDEHR